MDLVISSIEAVPQCKTPVENGEANSKFMRAENYSSWQKFLSYIGAHEFRSPEVKFLLISITL